MRDHYAFANSAMKSMKSMARRTGKVFVAFAIIGLLLAVLTMTLSGPRESPRVVRSRAGPEEDAWKLRVEFKRIADFPENELVRIEHVRIPGPNEILQPQAAYEMNGATIAVATIIGSKVAWERVYQFNPERVRDCVT